MAKLFNSIEDINSFINSEEVSSTKLADIYEYTCDYNKVHLNIDDYMQAATSDNIKFGRLRDEFIIKKNSIDIRIKYCYCTMLGKKVPCNHFTVHTYIWKNHKDYLIASDSFETTPLEQMVGSINLLGTLFRIEELNHYDSYNYINIGVA